MTVVLTVLAAYGLLLLCWCSFGMLLLPATGDGYCVLFAAPGCLGQIRAFVFLQETGLLRVPLYAVDRGLAPEDAARLARLSDRCRGLVVFSPQEWEEFKKTESRERVSGP